MPIIEKPHFPDNVVIKCLGICSGDCAFGLTCKDCDYSDLDSEHLDCDDLLMHDAKLVIEKFVFESNKSDRVFH